LPNFFDEEKYSELPSTGYPDFWWQKIIISDDVNWYF